MRSSVGIGSLIGTGVFLSGAMLVGCGGGGGGTQPPPGNYTLTLSSNSLSISGGNSASITVTVTPSNGFIGGVTLTLSGIPVDVTVSPNTAVSLAPGTSQTYTFAVPTYISASTSTVTVAGSSGPGYEHSASLSLQVSAYAGNTSLNRSGYVGLDAVEPYTVFFDSVTDRFFMSDPGSNQIMVVDAATRKELGTIPVPGAYGLDETPDHKTMWVGTEIGDVYTVNPVTMTVMHRYEYSQIGPSGFQANTALALANGDIALLGASGGGGVNSSDGFGSFAVWNPLDNSIHVYAGGSNDADTCSSMGHNGALGLSADRNTIIVSGGYAICTVNTITGLVNTSTAYGFPVVPTPDGKSILVLQYGINAQMIVLDAQTLAQTASFPVVGTDGSYVVVSPDASTVYIAPLLGGWNAYAYNIASGTQTGWMPDVSTQSASAPIGTWISAVDDTGLLAGVSIEGMGFLDASAMQTGPVGEGYSLGYLDPATGPTAGGTQVNFSFGSDVTAVYFGNTQSPSIAPESGVLYATSPPGPAGPVDVDILLADGGEVFDPLGFSYGPSIEKATSNFSTAEGGGTETVVGYGFGPGTGQNHVVPSSLSVTVGGAAAKITDFNLNPYNVDVSPEQSFSFTIPAGTEGPADIQVNSASGSTTLKGGLTYLPAVQQVSVSGTASIAQGIYDPKRDVYYFTDVGEVRIYSRTQSEWLAPIQVPAAPAGTTHRLWGIALSPDGTKLAVADQNAGMIYVLDPDTPANVKSYTFNVAYVGGVTVTGQGASNPTGVAISDAGMIYLAAPALTCDGCDGFFRLDTSTGAVTDYGITGFGPGLYKVAITSDNSTVFFNNQGAVFSIDTATDKISYALNGQGCCYGDFDLTLAAGQSTLEATSFLWSTNLNAESYLTLDDPHSLNINYVYGTQLSGDGTLLFQPMTNGIDVYDGRLGTLLDRVALPVALSQNYDALVGDGKDNVLIAITGQTGSGIAIVDLSSLPAPAALPYAATDTDFESAGSPVPVIGHHSGRETLLKARIRPGIVPAASIPHVVNAVRLPGRRPGPAEQRH